MNDRIPSSQSRLMVLFISWALTAGAAWSQSLLDNLPAPPKPAIGAPVARPDKPVHTEHALVSHLYITRKAFEMYNAQFPGSELAKYIGDYAGDAPKGEADDNVVKGAYDEDKPFQNPFNHMIPEMRHFWDVRQGPYKGLSDYDSAVNRAQKYFSGGYGLDGQYDEAWSDNSGDKTGIKGEGVLALYAKGDKAKAYWYLGHAAHLLEDLTVPAHTLLWPHPVPNSDAYETYMKTNHARWQKLPSGSIESFDSLYDIFEKTASTTNNFDAGFAGGDLSGRDGTVDQGKRREGGFTDEKLDQEGDVLMPLAFKRVAALFKYFYKQIDHTPPQVTLNVVNEPEGIVLSAEAKDDLSGVDAAGFSFQYAVWTGKAWSQWKEVPTTSGGPRAGFQVEPGQRYAFKATAQDGAGNVGESAVKHLDAPASVLFL